MIIPDGRTMSYAIWRACQEFGLKPWEDWDELPPDIQAEMIAFSQIRNQERAKEKAEMLSNLAKAMTPRTKK